MPPVCREGGSELEGAILELRDVEDILGGRTNAACHMLERALSRIHFAEPKEIIMVFESHRRAQMRRAVELSMLILGIFSRKKGSSLQRHRETIVTAVNHSTTRDNEGIVREPHTVHGPGARIPGHPSKSGDNWPGIGEAGSESRFGLGLDLGWSGKSRKRSAAPPHQCTAIGWFQRVDKSR
jgi:hypothetical protein